MIQLLNTPNMDYMKTLEDNTFSIGIVDPPLNYDKAQILAGVAKKHVLIFIDS